MILVVDFIRGSRAGQREVFRAPERIRLGRHPQNEIVFDAHRDIDASSRHAEIRSVETGFVLADVGSSNGTWVGGDKISEMPLSLLTWYEVEFGEGGPALSLWLGPEEQKPPPPAQPRRRPLWLWMVIGLAVSALAAAAIWHWSA